MTEEKKKRGPRKTLEQRMRAELEAQRRLVHRLRVRLDAHDLENRRLCSEHDREQDRLHKLDLAISTMMTLVEDGSDS